MDANDKTTNTIDFIDRNLLENIIESFSEATGLRAFITDQKGVPLISPRTSELPDFCKIITESAGHKCHKSYATAGRESLKWDEPYVFRCHAGLIGLAAPIVDMSGLHMGSIICGQVLMWQPEDFFWDEIMEMTKGIGTDFKDIKKAALGLKIMSPKKVESAANLLYITARVATQTGFTIYKQRSINEERQVKLNDKMMEKTASFKSLPVYSLGLERKLLNCVREDQMEQALLTVDYILLSLLPKWSTRPNFVKARMLELLVLISRAFADKGCDIEKLLELNIIYLSEMSRIQLADELYEWFRTVVKGYFYNTRSEIKKTSTKIMEKVLNYIKNEYDEEINLDKLSQTFSYSPAYLSVAFKKEFGTTITEYLTSVRIEKAKELLVKTEKNLSEVANEVGFNSESYFTRVFKKNVGIPPGKYRYNSRVNKY